jgi:hypothetical protein
MAENSSSSGHNLGSPDPAGTMLPDGPMADYAGTAAHVMASGGGASTFIFGAKVNVGAGLRSETTFGGSVSSYHCSVFEGTGKDRRTTYFHDSSCYTSLGIDERSRDRTITCPDHTTNCGSAMLSNYGRKLECSSNRHTVSDVRNEFANYLVTVCNHEKMLVESNCLQIRHGLISTTARRTTYLGVAGFEMGTSSCGVMLSNRAMAKQYGEAALGVPSQDDPLLEAQLRAFAQANERALRILTESGMRGDRIPWGLPRPLQEDVI